MGLGGWSDKRNVFEANLGYYVMKYEIFVIKNLTLNFLQKFFHLKSFRISKNDVTPWATSETHKKLSVFWEMYSYFSI